MKLPLELNKTQMTANVVFAVPADFCFLAEWKKALGDDTNPIRKDAVDFAQLAIYRFQAHSATQAYARSVDEIGDHIKANPHCEVAGFVLLKCDWFPDSKVIGLCHFRRTWSNNIILDYLAAHPCIANPPPVYLDIVRGAGVALLYFLCQVAKRYGCGAIWGEATPLSWEFYKHVLKLDLVEDLIYAPPEKFLAFADIQDMKRVERGDATTIKSPALAEIYEIESTNPPFVGSKTAVFNPARRLAYRFLDLPIHVQMNIAQGLGLLQDEDKDKPAAEQFRRFFKRASANGKLPNLWQQVEKQYPDGEPDKNPFPTP